MNNDDLLSKIKIDDRRIEGNKDPTLLARTQDTLELFIRDPRYAEERANFERAADAYGSVIVRIKDSEPDTVAGTSSNLITFGADEIGRSTYPTTGGGTADVSLQQAISHESGHLGNPLDIEMNKKALLAGYESYSKAFPEKATASNDNQKIATALAILNNPDADKLEKSAIYEGAGPIRMAFVESHPEVRRGELTAMEGENRFLAKNGLPARDIERYEEAGPDMGRQGSPGIDDIPGFSEAVAAFRSANVKTVSGSDTLSLPVRADSTTRTPGA